MNTGKLILAIVLSAITICFSCKKETRIVYTNVPADSAHISITNVSPVIANLLFYVDNKSVVLPDSPLSYGNTTFANNVRNSDGISASTVELPYFNILNGYRKISFASGEPSAFFSLDKNFEPGEYYSVFITDSVRHGQTQYIVLHDKFIPNDDTAKAVIRFLNLSPDAPPMDIWAFPNAGNNGVKTFSGCSYLPNDVIAQQSADSFAVIKAGPYYFAATVAGTSNILLGGGLIIRGRNAITIYTKGFLNGTGDNAMNVGLIFYKP